MIRVFKVILCFQLSLVLTPGYAEMAKTQRNPFANLNKSIAGTYTLQSLLKKFKKEMPQSTWELINKKANDLPPGVRLNRLKLEKKSETQYIIEVGSTLTRLDFSKMSEQLMSVNNKWIKFGPNMTYDELYKSLEQAMPNSKVSLWSYLLPSAQAVPMALALIPLGIIVLMSVGSALSIGAKILCTPDELKQKKCGAEMKQLKSVWPRAQRNTPTR